MLSFLAQNSWIQATYQQGIICDWLEGTYSFLGCPGWELHAKIREAGSHLPSPDYLEPTATEIVLWIPRLVTTEVVGQSFIIIYGLAIVHLHIQSLKVCLF